jgi:hypothetical protein
MNAEDPNKYAAEQDLREQESLEGHGSASPMLRRLHFLTRLYGT